MTSRSFVGEEGYVGYRTRVTLVREGLDHEAIRLSQPQEVYDFMGGVSRSDRESLYSIMLDAANQVVGCDEVSRGSLNTTRTAPREVYKSAIVANALGIILAHNHPSGVLEPSAEDLAFTTAMAQAGQVVGIELYDHVIFSDRGYTSLRDRGHL